MASASPDESLQFEPGDTENPRNWPSWRKWSIIITLVPVDLCVSWAASCFSPISMQFAEEFGISDVVATLGLSIEVLGLAAGPMVMAPLSEYFGRKQVYIVSWGIFLCWVLGTALVHDLGGFLALRFLSGVFSSMTISNVGGNIADMWPHHDPATSLAMSLWLWAATGGSPTGVFLFSFIGGTRPWRDVFWALLGIGGGFWILMMVVLKETRHTTILRRRAKEELKRNPNAVNDPRYKNALRHRPVKELFKIALARPFRFLFTEAIIVYCALYNGYLYGLSYLFNGAFTLVFGPKGHGFSTIGVGLCFLGIIVGISIGPLTNLWQTRYYLRKTGGDPRVNEPEARVQLGMIAAVTHPIALFWFAWTTYKSVHFIVPILASALWGWSFYTLILMTYSYIEDSYGVYAASALAGTGLVRNLAGGGFPLFAPAMFENEGYQWAGSILAFLALALVPIPFILQRYGPRLRRNSPFASQHLADRAHLVSNAGTPGQVSGEDDVVESSDEPRSRQPDGKSVEI